MPEYRRLEIEGAVFPDGEFVRVASAAIRGLTAEAFHDAAFFFRTAHLEQVAAAAADRDASENDRYIARLLLENAVIAALGQLPMCQDTGTATIMAWKGENVLTGGDDRKAISAGVEDAWRDNYLRHSQLAATSMFDEADTGNNLPAAIDIQAVAGDEYRFLFVAKGGGSANKTALFQESKALLNEGALDRFVREKIEALGTAACPPYHLALVVGGLSPEHNLKTLKLLTAGYLDDLPTSGSSDGRPFRDRLWEARVREAAVRSNLGAQFGGRYLALDARVVRLPRHAGSCPVSIGVSCSADRNILGRIDRTGSYLEVLDRDPARFLDGPAAPRPAPKVNLDQPMTAILAALSAHRAGTLVFLNGPLVVARDIAHARLDEMRRAGRRLPDWSRDYPVYYAGPSKTPPDHVIGSFGPTTAQRMDGYLRDFMAEGASLVTLAKGNRSPHVARACGDYGGFYLATVGGAAALLAARHIVASEILDFEDLGMEAVRRIVVKDFPALIVCDSGGNDFYAQLRGGRG